MGYEKRATFNQVAELYDDVRPHYPAQLLEDLVSLAQLSPDDWILEVGAGTGRVISHSDTKISPKLLDCRSNVLHAVNVEVKPAERVDVFPNERRYVA